MKEFEDLVNSSASDSASKVLELIFNYGQIDGSHHKLWVLDQIARTLTNEKYDRFVHFYEFGCSEDHQDGSKCPTRIQKYKSGEYYEWDTGVAP